MTTIQELQIAKEAALATGQLDQAALIEEQLQDAWIEEELSEENAMIEAARQRDEEINAFGRSKW